MGHRLHVISLPHTNTTLEYSSCAYTEKVRKFCNMMSDQGNQVFLYAGEQNEAKCVEHIPCITEYQRSRAVGKKHYTEASFDINEPQWVTFTKNANRALHARLQPHDFICLIAGVAQKPIADEFPNYVSVEFGVGYAGTFSKYKVWESYAWMHTVMGAKSINNAHAIDGNWFDAVIPGYLDDDLFPFVAVPDDYYLYIGRLIDRKGLSIAVDVCNKAGQRLLVAGPGTPPPGVKEYVGEVGPKERAALMGGARAILAPTIYIEPFGNVVPEAAMCGTPAITTDWGAFTETVIQGVTGYRCRMHREFLKALADVRTLDRGAVRMHASTRYSSGVVAQQYQAYFDRLSTLWDKGYYAP